MTHVAVNAAALCEMLSGSILPSRNTSEQFVVMKVAFNSGWTECSWDQVSNRFRPLKHVMALIVLNDICTYFSEVRFY